jgi:hypothetical protein
MHILYAAVIVIQIVDLGTNLLYSVLDLFGIECGSIMYLSDALICTSIAV